MNRIKELATKGMEFIKAKKGYCIIAAALIVLLVAVVPNLNIETVDQHNARKNDETQKRQELLAELEESDAEGNLENASTDEKVSGGAASGDNPQSHVSGQGIVTADGTTSTGGTTDTKTGNPDGTTTDSQSETQKNVGQNQTTSQNSSTGGQTAASQNSTTGSQTTTSQSGNQNQSQSTGQSQIGNQSQSGSQNQSQSTGQSQTGNQNQSQSTSQSQTGNQNQSQSTNQNQSQGDSSTNQEDEYIIVTVKIVCDNVVNNPDLTTSAQIPSDGVILEAKTAVKKGETVFDALKAVCTDNGISYTHRGPASSAYITSIGGLSEKECGKYSGWKYKVNGVVSGKSCGAHKLNNNDEVLWYYATSTNQ